MENGYYTFKFTFTDEKVATTELTLTCDITAHAKEWSIEGLCDFVNKLGFMVDVELEGKQKIKDFVYSNEVIKHSPIL